MFEILSPRQRDRTWKRDSSAGVGMKIELIQLCGEDIEYNYGVTTS